MQKLSSLKIFATFDTPLDPRSTKVMEWNEMIWGEFNPVCILGLHNARSKDIYLYSTILETDHSFTTNDGSIWTWKMIIVCYQTK